jgi:superfamily II DNA or RNA helicase/diadenosine tetraphosphate (Ap4A) HIT family hydrolase
MNTPCPFCQPDPGRVFHISPLIVGLWDQYPVSPGHALLVPRRHTPTWFDATREEQMALMEEGVERARQEILKRYRPDGFNIGINVAEAAGQTVFHLHVHVIPRYEGDVPNPRGGVRYVIPHKANYTTLDKPDLSLLGGRPHPRGLVRGEQDPLLPHLLADLDRAVAADIAVAFVVQSGVRLVEEHLRDLLMRRGQVRFLTGDYLDVTEPEALSRLLDLNGHGQLGLKVFETRERSFHPKAFLLFFPDGTGAAYIGSSNLTRTALREGVEWNYRVDSRTQGSWFADIQNAFDALYAHPSTRSVDPAWVQAYRARRRVRKPIENLMPVEPEPELPTPHGIQQEALAALKATRVAGNSAGLVVLATGLGKTWLSAFDSAQPEFKRILFVAHREEILNQAIKTFRTIRPEAVIGRYDGNNHDAEADILFASIMTLGKNRHLKQFSRDHFDYIVVDEFHHAQAKTYRNLIDHFEPKFLLGLTATPERTDGGDLLALCQENLVFNCDMFEGIEQELLCPFKYFGVPDDVDYANIPWRSNRFDEEKLTEALATQKRADNALEQFRKLGQRRALGFCCSLRHADFMANWFQQKGVRAVAVHSGEGSAPRASSLEDLEKGKLEIVFAVDMFNEGVDIPSVDTVLMLRPTESTIIWQQQFGRGLRKAAGKSHVAVIDYIGNHRIFLTKVRSLFRIQPPATDLKVRQYLDLVAKGEINLPDGCSVTYELQAIKLLEELLRSSPATEVLTAYYLDYRDRHGERPTATEAFHDGYDPGKAGKRASWPAFVDAMGDLSAQDREALHQHGEFITALQKTKMVKSYKMLTLLAMLETNRFPGRISIQELVQAFRRFASRSAKLREDVGDSVADDHKLQRHIETNPIDAWVGGAGMGGKKYFAYDGNHLSTTFHVKPECVEAFQELVRELVDWRLADYLAGRSGTFR